MKKSSSEIAAENIKRLRKLKKLTQEELAFRAGFHPSYIGLLERKDQSPSLKSLDKIAYALNVTPAKLIAGADVRKYDEKSVLAGEMAELLKPLSRQQMEALLSANKLLVKAMTGNRLTSSLKATDGDSLYTIKKQKKK